jgi:hypothetical protein
VCPYSCTRRGRTLPPRSFTPRCAGYSHLGVPGHSHPGVPGHSHPGVPLQPLTHARTHSHPGHQHTQYTPTRVHRRGRAFVVQLREPMPCLTTYLCGPLVHALMRLYPCTGAGTLCRSIARACCSPRSLADRRMRISHLSIQSASAISNVARTRPLMCLYPCTGAGPLRRAIARARRSPRLLAPHGPPHRHLQLFC